MRGSALAAVLLAAALLPIAPVRAASTGRASSRPPVTTGRLEPMQVLGVSPAWKVPAFVVYVGKAEAGRIAEESEVSVESGLAGILERAAGG
ncbi:MAG TPA: hypothetical protein VNI57_06110 [Candidatus Saccharimonadales bacterium]|nr:hypothetical protein [Candidatus Saccharimonadales bacterium]